MLLRVIASLCEKIIIESWCIIVIIFTEYELNIAQNSKQANKQHFIFKLCTYDMMVEENF